MPDRLVARRVPDGRDRLWPAGVDAGPALAAGGRRRRAGLRLGLGAPVGEGAEILAAFDASGMSPAEFAWPVGGEESDLGGLTAPAERSPE